MKNQKINNIYNWKCLEIWKFNNWIKSIKLKKYYGQYCKKIKEHKKLFPTTPWNPKIKIIKNHVRRPQMKNLENRQ